VLKTSELLWTALAAETWLADSRIRVVKISRMLMVMVIPWIFLKELRSTHRLNTKGIKTSGKNSKHNQFWKKANSYKHKWIQHVHRTDRSRFPYAVMKNKPAGKRNPVARWWNSWIVVSGQEPNPWEHDDDGDIMCIFVFFHFLTWAT
jgi:hypothetical protein